MMLVSSFVRMPEADFFTSSGLSLSISTMEVSTSASLLLLALSRGLSGESPKKKIYKY